MFISVCTSFTTEADTVLVSLQLLDGDAVGDAVGEAALAGHQGHHGVHPGHTANTPGLGGSI